MRIGLTHLNHCPTREVALPARGTDGSVLPDPARASAAVLAAAGTLAPGQEILLNYSRAFTATDKLAGIPQVVLIFDIGDRTGYGSVNMQILPSLGTGTPAQLAQDDLNRWDKCVDVARLDFPDGSVALYYPYGPPEQELQTTHVWYYAVAGYTMNIGAFPMAWSMGGSDPNVAPPPSTLPARGSQPLDIVQLMALADTVAHS